MPIIMRWKGELHWHTMDPPVSGSELRSMVQAFLFHEHAPPPVLRLVDEASGVEHGGQIGVLAGARGHSRRLGRCDVYG